MAVGTDGAITLKVGVDTSGVDRKLSFIKKDAENVGNAFKRAGEKIAGAFSGKNISSEKYKEATATLEREKEKLAELRRELELLQAGEANTDTPAITKMADQMDQLREKISNTKSEIAQLEQSQSQMVSESVKNPITGDPLFSPMGQAEYDATSAKLDELRVKLEEDSASAEKLSQKMDSAIGESQEKAAIKLNGQIEAQEEKVNKLAAAQEKAAQSAGNAGSALGNALDSFGKRVTGLMKRILVFSVIAKAIRALAEEFKNIAMSNESFRANLEQLKAALYTLVQPIIAVLIPIIQTLVQWLTVAVVAVGKFFAAITGKNYADMAAAAEATKKQADAYKQSEKSSGKVAKNAAKTEKAAKGALASFDQLNTLSISENDSSGSGGAGAVDLTTEGVSPFSNLIDFDESIIDQKLANILEIVGGALIAIGVILLFFGQFPWALGAIIAGIVIFSVGAVSNYEEAGVEDPIKAMLMDLLTVVGMTLAVIGIILIFFGKFLIGIAALIAGIAMFGIGEANAEEGGIADRIKTWLQENGALIAGISLALLVLGIILLISGVGTAIGLGLLLAGAVGLGLTVAMNWGAISEKISNFFKENAALIAGVSLFLLVIGILLCISGVGIPIGIGLIAAGAVGLGTTIALNWNAIVDKVKDIGAKIGDVFKKVWEGIKKGFKAMVNGLISYANIWIDGLNAILIPIRAIIAGVANVFGKNVSIDSIKIPHIPKLAKGGIVPYATMAMVGENGAEAVLPLERNTEWMNLLADKLLSKINAANQTIILKVDSREIARATRTGESNLGTQTVYGGFANAR